MKKIGRSKALFLVLTLIMLLSVCVSSALAEDVPTLNPFNTVLAANEGISISSTSDPLNSSSGIVSVTSSGGDPAVAMLNIGSGSGAPGDTVQIQLAFSSDSAFHGIYFLPTYDETALTLTGITGDVELGEPDGVDLTFWFLIRDDAMTPFDANTAYSITLNFQINEQASAGSYPVSVSAPDGLPLMWSDGIDGLINHGAMVSNGTITVTSGGSTVTQLAAPVLNATPASKTDTSVTLAAPGASVEEPSAAVEYRSKLTSASDWGEWQTDAAFTGLTAVTSYDFQARYVAADTASWSDSEPSAAITVVTEDDGQPRLTVSSASAAPGDDVSVTVSIVNNPGNIIGAFFTLSYDSSALTPVSLIQGSLGQAPQSAVQYQEYGFPPYYEIYGSNWGVFSGDGDIATITFEVADGVSPGDYSISLMAPGYNAGFEYILTDTTWMSGYYTTATGTITVTGDGSSATRLAAPTLSGTPVSKTDTSVTLAAPKASAEEPSAAVEYRSKPTSASDWGEWQESAAFTGLTARTSYDFQARYVAADTASWRDSRPSAAITLITLVTASPREHEPTLSLSSPHAAPGEEVSVTFSIANNPGVAKACFLLTYDSNILTLLDVIQGSLGNTPGAPVPFVSGAVPFYDFTGPGYNLFYDNGDMAIIKFKVAADASPGDYYISVIPSSGTDGILLDATWNGWYCSTAIPGAITVTGGDPSVKQLAAPVLSGAPASKTGTSITLAAPTASAEDASAAVEYRSKLTSASDWGYWQTSAAFTGLTAVTSYDFQARYLAADTASWRNSEPSAAITVVTEDDGQPRLTVSSAGAAPGEEVSVTVSITHNPGNLLGGMFSLVYDENNLELVSVTEGELGTSVQPDQGGYAIWTSDSDADTSIAVITFRVKENAAPAAYTINIAALSSMSDGYNNYFFMDNDYNFVCKTATPGAITVTGGGGETPSDYTITPVASASTVKIDDTFTVDVVVSAEDEATEFAAVDAVLNYNSGLVNCTGVVLGPLQNGEATTGGRIALYDTASATVGSSGSIVAAYTFEAIAAGSAVFSISDGSIGKSGSTTDIPAASGDSAAVVISVKSDTEIVSNDLYKGAPAGYHVVRHIADTLPGEGEAYFFGDDTTTPLFYAGEDGGMYVFVGFVAESDINGDPVVTLKSGYGSTVALVYDGDISGNNVTNAIDALIAHELGNGVYLSDMFSKLSAQKRFEADVNSDGAVDSLDARAIIVKAIGG